MLLPRPRFFDVQNMEQRTLLLNLFTKFVYCGSHPTETELYSGRDTRLDGIPPPCIISSYVNKILSIGHPFALPHGHMWWWCCYKTVDSATAASPYGFCSDKLSLHRKTNVIQILMTKT
jgi:hypothetical protein